MGRSNKMRINVVNRIDRCEAIHIYRSDYFLLIYGASLYGMGYYAKTQRNRIKRKDIIGLLLATDKNLQKLYIVLVTGYHLFLESNLDQEFFSIRL